MRFGDEHMYKTRDKLSSTGERSWVNYNGNHQRDYGQYFYCYTKGLRGFTFYQDVKVHKADGTCCDATDSALRTAQITSSRTANRLQTCSLRSSAPTTNRMTTNTQQQPSTASVRLMPISLPKHTMARTTMEPVSDMPSSRESMKTRCRYVSTKPRMGRK